MALRVILLLLLLSGCTRPVETRYYPVPRDVWGHHPVITDYTEIVESAVVPPGHLQGVIVDAISGAPIQAVQVEIVGTNRGTVTDSSGRFVLPVDRTGVVRVVSIGYEEFRFGIGSLPQSDHGYAARITLRQRPVEICVTYLEEPSLVTVDVRDAITGTAPDRARLLVQWDGGEDSASAERAEQPMPLQLRAGPWRFGTFMVEVSAPGYSPWRQGVAIPSACGSPVPLFLNVWLIPTGAIGG